MAVVVMLACVISIIFVSMTLSFHVSPDVAATGHQSGHADQVYFQDGDVILGGVFPLHSYDEGVRACTYIREVRALKLVEAMVYTVGLINNSTDLLPGLELGFEVYDSCYSDIWTLKKSLNFLPPDQKRGCVGSWGEGAGTGSLNCLHQKRVAGVVGSQKSASSIELALLLGLYHIPQVSYLSTIDSLSEVNYPYFLRVVPSDRHQVNSIMDLVQYYGWTYISLLFSDDEYGENGYYEFTRQAADHNVCLAYAKDISIIFPETYFDDIVADLRREPFNRAVVVVLFANLLEARMLLEAVQRAGATGEFTFIASDGIGNFGRNGLNGLENAALGMITMVPYSHRLSDFNDFFLRSLSPNSSNPWTAEYMDAYTWCEFVTGNICAINRTDFISPHETLVIDSVYAFAYALDSMLSEKCGGREGWGGCTAVDDIDGEVLLTHLKKTDFQSLSNGRVTFDANGDGIPRYRIRNLNNELFGWPTFVDVGSWREYDDAIDIGDSVRFYTRDVGGFPGGVPRSVCSAPCPVGSRKDFFEDEAKCCWLCVECGANATVANDGTECHECVPPEWPDANRTECVQVTASYMTWGTVEGTGVNILVTVAVLEALLILLLYFPQLRRRIVWRSDPMLCMFVHLGACLLLAAAISATFKPTPGMCVLTRMGPSIAYALIFVPFAMKSARLYQVFIKARDTDSEEEANLWGITKQLLVLTIIWIIEVGVSLSWILVFPPEASYAFVPINRPKGGALAIALFITCNFQLHETITEVCFAVLFLLVALTLSLLARALPDNYHEARFCVFASAGSLLVITGAYAVSFVVTAMPGAPFLPVMYRALGMIAISILVMTCLFVPKMYVIYFVRGNIDEVMLRKRQSVASNMAVNRVRASTLSSLPAINGELAGRRRSRARSMWSNSEASSGDHGVELKAISTSVI